MHVPTRHRTVADVVIAGETDLTFATSAINVCEGVRLRPLASTAPSAPSNAGRPTMKERESKASNYGLYGVLAPSATPRPMVAALAAAVARRRPTLSEKRLAEQGAEPVGNSSEDSRDPARGGNALGRGGQGSGARAD